MMIVKKGDVVWPEVMSGKGPELPKENSYGGWGSGGVWITGVSNNPKNTILRQWAGCPRLLAGCGEPLVRVLVLHMSRVDQSDQHIDIEQVSDQGSSSASCFTMSDVTLGAFG